MYLNDPYQPVVVRREKGDAPAPDPRAEFYAEYRGGRGHTVGPRQPPAMVDICGYVNGRHVFRGKHCPHFREPVEEKD